MVSHDTSADRGLCVAPSGSLELCSSLRLWEQVKATAATPDKGPVILDLRQVDFVDSAGIATLVLMRKFLSQEGRCFFLLLSPGGQPDRVLKLGNFRTALNAVYSLDDLPEDTNSRACLTGEG